MAKNANSKYRFIHLVFAVQTGKNLTSGVTSKAVNAQELTQETKNRTEKFTNDKYG